jgi:heat shock protein HslJ
LQLSHPIRPSACNLPLVAALVVAALAGCGSSSSDNTSSEVEDSYPLVGMYTSTADVQEKGMAFSSPVAVVIDKSEITWHADCATFGARLSKVDDQLMIEGTQSTTAKGCSNGTKQQDEDLTTFFESDPTWQLNGTRLALSNDDIEVSLHRVHPTLVTGANS